MFKIKNLTVKFNNSEIIKINSFSFPQKGLVIIKGANGSGKTTLFKAMMNIIHYEGDIYYNDINIKEYKEDLYKKVCYIDQFGNLINYLTEKENYSIIEDVLKKENNFVLMDRKLNKLSGGQRKVSEEKRIDISSYETFLLDEPTVSLDKHHKSQLIEKIKDISKDKLVVIITHEIELFEDFATIYDIDELEKDINIQKKNNYNINDTKSNFNYWKISIKNILINIIPLIFLTLTTFFLICLSCFCLYKSSDFYNKIADNFVYFEIDEKNKIDTSKKRNFSENNNPTRYLTYNYAVKSFSLITNENKPLLKRDIYNIYFDLEGEECKITDALSYRYFGDYLDHAGETIKYCSFLGEEIEFTISETIDTMFDSNINEENFKLISRGVLYLVLPLSYKEFFENDLYQYIGPAIKTGDVIPKDYVPYLGEIIFSINDATTYVENQRFLFFVYTFLSILLLCYSYILINFNNKKEFSDIYKLRTIGLSNKKIVSIFNKTFIIMSFISLVLGLGAYVYLYFLNIKFEPAIYRRYGLFIELKFYAFVIVFVLLFLLVLIRYLYFKKKLGIYNDIANKES